jgi:hypothetical protein
MLMVVERGGTHVVVLDADIVDMVHGENRPQLLISVGEGPSEMETS